MRNEAAAVGYRVGFGLRVHPAQNPFNQKGCGWILLEARISLEQPLIVFYIQRLINGK